jgi:hypothetical protein
MATKEDIIKKIDRYIRSKSFLELFWGYDFWYVGITEHPTRRKGEHGNPEKWRAWRTSDSKTARAIEKHFINKGMTGDTGGGKEPLYVYVY